MGKNNLLFSVIGLGFSLSVGASSVPNRVLVKFREGEVSVSSTIQNHPATRSLGVASRLLSLKQQVSLVRYSTSMTPAEAARALESLPNVEWAQPDYVVGIFPQPQDEENMDVSPDYSFIGAFKTLVNKPTPVKAPSMPSPPVVDPRLPETWGLTKIEAPAAWHSQKGNRKVIVADIDTGIDYRHEDLVNNLWEGIGYDFSGNQPLPFDDNQHGTHTAGTIGATGGNGLGVSGVSPEVSVMAIKFISKEGSGTTSDAIRSIDFAIEHGARIMSNSWGGHGDAKDDENKALEEAVERANKADILFVAAAGNDGTDNDVDNVFPAGYRNPNVLTVASISPKDAISFFSNYGKESVHVAAPGGGVLSTIPDNKYAKFNGTSMACPHVAGLAALILAERPNLTAVQVKQIIMETVDSLPSLQGKTVTGGRINARAALERAKQFAI